MKNHLSLTIAILSVVTLTLSVVVPLSSARAEMSFDQRDARISFTQENFTDDPEVEYQGARIVHNVTVDGQKGMRIHAKFKVRHGLDVNCRLIGYFFNDDGSPILANDSNYRDAEGGVSAHKDFKPQYDPAQYDDLQIFAPYSALNLGPSGEYQLKFYLALYDMDGKRFFGKSGWYKFTMTK